MSNFKTFTTLTLTALFAVAIPAFAQDAQESKEAPLDVTPMHEGDIDPVSSKHFASADLDQNGALNADEFVSFAVMQSDSGPQTFKDVVLSGEYEPTFTAHDKDASGDLSASELGHAKTSSDMESEDEMLDAPDLN